MKTKTTIFIVGLCAGVSLLGFGRNRGSPELINPLVAWQTVMESKLFVSPMKLGRWYEGRVLGDLDMGTSDHPMVVHIDGSLGFGGSSQQSFLNYRGSIGSYQLNIDWLQEQDQVYVRSNNIEQASGLDQQVFINKLLGKLSQTNGKFVYLRGFNPMQWVSWIIQPQKLLYSIKHSISFDAAECVKNQNNCNVIIDPDFINSSTDISGSSLDYSVVDFIGGLKKQAIIFHPREGDLIIEQMTDDKHDLSAALQADRLHLLYVTRGLFKTVYDIDHVISGNTHTIDVQVDREEQTLYSLRSQYEVYPDGWDMKLDSMLSGSIINIEGKRYDAGVFVPVQKGEVEDIYGLLGSKN